jgi:outer membrane protein TolC
MKIGLAVFMLLMSFASTSQSLNKIPDSIRRKMNDNDANYASLAVAPAAVQYAGDSDELIKNKLLRIALRNNPEITTADANVQIAEISRKKANSTMLSSISLGGNANEFVINNSPASNFYPKYNIGATIPLDILAKSKAEKRTADQQIIINNAQKQLVQQDLKARLFTLYETYKEKKALVELQKIAMEDDLAAYDRAQTDFKDEVISLADLNKIYKASIFEKALLVTKEKDLRIAIIQLEAMLNMPLDKALK